MPSDAPPRPERPADRTRDHLANQRTFLAWLRTALALIGFGFVLARMGLFLRQLAFLGAVELRGRLHPGHEFLVTGVVFLLLGTALAGWSAWIYHRDRRAIDAQQFAPARASVTILATVVVLGGLIIAGLMIWRTEEPDPANGRPVRAAGLRR